MSDPRATSPSPPPRSDRIALRVLQAGALAVVLAAAPWKAFDLDRFFVPKELVLHATATLAVVLLAWRVRRLSLSRVDQLLALYLAASGLSALFATNHWLAARALAISLAGACCFWGARSIAREGLARPLLAALALAGITGALSALLQAYGLSTEYVSLNRAPGGTFGNRNFMAHLCAITLPALALVALRARTRASLLRWCAGAALVGGALVLSRSRAAWLALVVVSVVLLVPGVLALRRPRESVRMRRLMLLLAAGAAGAGAALVLPNTLDWRSDSPYLDTARSVVDYRQGSGHGRLMQYGTSLRMSVHHPLLGVGPGNWAVVYPRFAPGDDSSIAGGGMTSNPWPSSDWMTFVSERGVTATLLLALVMLGLLTDGWRAVRTSDDVWTRLSACALLGTVTAIVVTGAFDAVLLLPAPAMVGWSLLGALSAPSRERAAVDLGTPQRSLLVLFAAALGATAVARSACQLQAMAIASTSYRMARLEQASALDPGSYRIHLRLANGYLGRGRCDRARAHAESAHALFPAAAAPARVLSRCGR